MLTSSATVQTKTDGSIGLLAQSIGGGGGNGGNSVTGGTGTSKGSLSVSVGGGGGTGNKAGTVNLTSSNDVTTLGDRAYGMLGQSIGGVVAMQALLSIPLLRHLLNLFLVVQQKQLH